MDKKNNKWGFLAPTRKEAKRMEKKYGVHFTPLIDYMKVIFPDIDDWEEEKEIECGIVATLFSAQHRKVVLVAEDCSVVKNFQIQLLEDKYDCYLVRLEVQLTNATVKYIFGVDVSEPLFDENIPTLTQPWVEISGKDVDSLMSSSLNGEKYRGDDKQWAINKDACCDTRLSKIIVEKLFNLYTYEIDLNAKKNDISILIGPNGCGKTTILKIVRFMLSGKGDLQEIIKIPFANITCKLMNRREIRLEHCNDKINIYIDEINVTDDFHESLKKYACYSDIEDIKAQRLLCEANDVLKTDDNTSQYMDAILGIQEHFKNFCEEAEKEYRKDRSSAEENLFFTYMLETEMLKEMLQKLTESEECKKYREFDSYKEYMESKICLPDSVFEEKWKEFLGKKYKYEQNEAINSYFGNNEEKERKDLERNIYEKVSEIYKNKGDKKDFLSIYLNMFNGTLNKFGQAHEKTIKFQEIINDRFKITKKTLRYHFGKMYLMDKNGQNIPFDVLSTGEKNDFVMFYNLIFKFRNCMVLIDEPEISLHINWQERYIDDLYEICKMNNIRALIATHSPNIINDHTNLIVKWDVKHEY